MTHTGSQDDSDTDDTPVNSKPNPKPAAPFLTQQPRSIMQAAADSVVAKCRKFIVSSAASARAYD